MKIHLNILVQMVFLLLLSRLSFSQEVEVNLGGNSTSDAFVVKDSSGNVLLKMDGDKNFGINSDQPDGIEVKGKAPITDQEVGGLIKIIGGGDGSNIPGHGGSVSILGGSGFDGAGSVIISSGYSSDRGGNVDITTGAGGDGGGNINIYTHPYMGNSAGNITINTGTSNDWGGSITLATGNSNGGGNDIILSTGGTASYENGNSIKLKEVGIEIRPAGLVEVIGSGTYTGTWSQASDERYKSNIKPLLDISNKVNLLQPVEYDWNREDFPENNFPEGHQIGLIAQEVEKLFPEMVATNQDGYKSIDYSKISVLLIQAMKEQQNEIEKQSDEMEKQSDKIEKQSDEINKMKSDIEELKSMVSQESNKFSSSDN